MKVSNPVVELQFHDATYAANPLAKVFTATAFY